MAQKGLNSRSGRVSRGEKSRHRILNLAIKTASEQGLEALTIGRMAAKLGMSKSGLFVHFGSKQKLQLVTIERANASFESAVLAPAEEGTRGIERLWTLCDLWLGHLETRVFPTGYFFTGAFLEYGERRGPLTRSLRAAIKTWLNSLKRSIQHAQDLEELQSEPNAEEMAFELNALLVGAYWAHLAGSGDAYRTARRAIFNRLRSWATDQIPSRALKSVRAWKRYLQVRARRRSGADE
jgi:AcrR family transcriptional regulator